MERLEIIKNARGPTLRSQLVTEVCGALLAAGSAKGYTFHKVADAPGPSRLLRIELLVGAKDICQFVS